MRLVLPRFSNSSQMMLSLRRFVRRRSTRYSGTRLLDWPVEALQLYSNFKSSLKSGLSRLKAFLYIIFTEGLMDILNLDFVSVQH